ncbi:DUF2309 domain-containing protein [Spirosoma aerolatum]|uniref:DUF2309 domain-containing protein n=1 Tax=Spirosoma aerolatum TaxID=1211326 RepID=UPI0009ABD8E9|nr:DUF2309 domain-containing protein [Spirosoma aerolatum]
METVLLPPSTDPMIDPIDNLYATQVVDSVTSSFKKIAPFWPLKNLIAVNPLQGFEELPIEEALAQGKAYFQQPTLPEPIEAINRQTIKWLTVYADDGQATLPMPMRHLGLFAAWRQLAIHDKSLYDQDTSKRQWLANLPEQPVQALRESLFQLGITNDEHEQFLTLMLTTLPGWASYIRYRTDWAGLDAHHPHPVTQVDYLALRVIITALLWPEARTLLTWHQQVLENTASGGNQLAQLQQAERTFRLPLLKQLAAQSLPGPHVPDAQFVFCIDVRSEPFRRALEATGDYQTLGFAGFFGLPIQITDTVTGESYASCPVLLTPNHTIHESPCGTATEQQRDRKSYAQLKTIKRLYQSLKYTFTTPFALVEGLGLASGTWMGLRSLVPGLAYRLQNQLVRSIRKPMAAASSWNSISGIDQCRYAEGALRAMGLTQNFAPVVIFCGHGSSTQNNAYATALDCGACGGRHGGGNARVLAGILNDRQVRQELGKKGIIIPDTTRFVAAEHNTTTDEVTLFGDSTSGPLQQISHDLAKARLSNSIERLKQFPSFRPGSDEVQQTWLRSVDWAQVRPEWGLARNAAFIVAPRALTTSLNLEGRCFLHSYDYTQDPQGTILTTILTAPMVVAQWINAQYLFSTLDNVAYGGGSKLTQNITGKIGLMQGNASDLMTGLPLQSVYASDEQAYHEPQRLLTVVYAPRDLLIALVQTQPVLQKLFGNGWVQLACLEPQDSQPYLLTRDFQWQSLT